jgi:hypothetical protein
MSLTSYGQDKAAMQKIESARIALITERLELTPSQAEKFWPLYREYNLQRRQMREEFRNTRQSVDRQNLSEEQSRELMQKVMDLKQQELNLEKKICNPHDTSDLDTTDAEAAECGERVSTEIAEAYSATATATRTESKNDAAEANA